MTSEPNRSRHPRASAVAIALAGGLLLPGGIFVTSGGVEIEMPAVDQMSCSALKAKLDQIDASGYRGLQPAPPNPHDKPLFEYETRVSSALYGKCPDRNLGPAQRSEVFRQGFRN
jgi:hypothetical protein